MALRPIVLHPDPVLRAPCAPVAEFDDPLRVLAADLLETMYAASGRGLAAPQVGSTLRIFVMDTGWKEGTSDPLVLINPKVVPLLRALVTGPESCLSVPGRVSQVPRSPRVAARWQDLDGTWHERQFDGIAAICLQHEADHLDGVLCIDREVSSTPAPPAP
ncbi:MAG: peptide deformylase [Rubellimicrobium sp.]|nr:peptide deformylase [Rubellimicrobium sp.]